MSVLVKIHKREGRTVVAVCDEDVAGQIFEEGNRVLDVRGEFYKGEPMDRKGLGDLLRNADGVNLVGKKSVQIGLDEGVIVREQVSSVAGIPHAQGLLVQ